MNKTFSVLVLLLSHLICECQTKDFSFEFEPDKNGKTHWNIDLKNSILVNDTLDLVSGKSSLCAQSVSFFGNNYAWSLRQYMQLPVQTNLLNVGLCSKSTNIKSAWLKIYLLDNTESLITKDSLKINDNKNTWNRNQLEIKTASARKIRIEIEVDNLQSGYKSAGKIWFDKMDLSLNGKPIQSFEGDEPDLTTEQMAGLNQNVPVDSNKIESLGPIKSLKSKRIIAIGESVHGIRDFNKMGIEIIKNQILNENCRLVIFEFSFDLGILINNYITGKTDINPEEYIDGFLYDKEQFKILVDWIKQYNADHPHKVYFAGMDMGFSSGIFKPEVIFKDFAIGKESQKIIELINTKNNKQALELFNSVSNSSLGITSVERKILTQYFKFLDQPRFSLTNAWNLDRDYFQFLNTRFAIDSLIGPNEKAVLYAHLGHVNKKNSIYIRGNSLGYYMAKYYKDDYFAIGLFAGEGNYSNFEKEHLIPAKLEMPPVGSLEALCNKADNKMFYKDISDRIQSIFYRSIGNGVPKTDFAPFNCLGRIDALIYLDKVTGIKIPNIDSLNSSIQNNLALKIDNFDNLGKIAPLKEKTIIGLAPTVHGCFEFEKMAYTIIKYLIEKENCRLVFLEIPFELGLLFNEYVSNGSPANVDVYLDHFINDKPETKQLLDWIRDFNCNNKGKVTLMGIDVNKPKSQDDYLLDLLNLKKSNSPDLATFRKMLIDKNQTSPILNFFQQSSNSLKTELGLKNYMNIERALKSRIYNSSRTRPITNIIDSIMFENTKFAIDNLLKENEKAALFVHYTHLNKDLPNNFLIRPPLGSYMAQYYQNKYFVIGMFCGTGNHTIFDFYKSKNTVADLNPPISGSFEAICLKSSIPVFYKEYDLQLIYKKIRLIDRIKLPTDNFFRFDNKGRIDAFIFINKVSSVKYISAPFQQ